MKRISVLAATAFAAIGIIAAVAAASASATVLCKTGESSTCSIANTYNTGTEISAATRSGGSVVFRTQAGEEWATCASGTIKVQSTDAGGEGKPVKTKDVGYSLTSCSSPMSFSQSGTWEVNYTGGGGGKIVDSGTILKVTSSLFGTCYYSFPTESVLNGGSSANILVDGFIAKQSGSAATCPTILRMTAEYAVSSPAPLFVEERQASPAVLCSANEEHCTEAHRYGAGTKVAAGLKAGSSFVLVNRSHEELDGCETSTLEGEVSSGGGASSVPLASLSTVGFGKCTFSTSAVGLPWQAEFNRSGSTGNGTVTVNGFKVEANTLFYGVCVYGGNATFTFTGGAPAEVSATEVKLQKQTGSKFACPAEAFLNTKYVMSSPSPLYVSSP